MISFAILTLALAQFITQVYHNWAMKAMITSVDEAEIFTKACCDVKSKLAGLTIKWLQETCLALESHPNLTAVLTGMWNMMRLVCRCGTGDCLKVVKLMTQELIGRLVLYRMFSGDSAPILRYVCSLT